MKNIDLYKKALEQWGDISQLFMLFEEIGELMQKLSHSYRNNRYVRRDEVIEEIVDVEIMLEQIKVMYEVMDDEYCFIKDKKLKLLEGMLK